MHETTSALLRAQLCVTYASNGSIAESRQGRFAIVVTGLLVLVAGYVFEAIASGTLFGPSTSLTDLEVVVLSIPAFVESAAWLLLALAAFGRLTELPARQMSAR